jgi:hypothetical protein
MANKTIPQLDPYGSVDIAKVLKDLIEITLNTGTYGTPVYASGASRKLTIEQLINILGLLGFIPLSVTTKLTGNIESDSTDFQINRSTDSSGASAYILFKKNGPTDYETEIGASTGESGTTWLRFKTNEPTVHEGNVIVYNGDLQDEIDATPYSLVTKEWVVSNVSSGGAEITDPTKRTAAQLNSNWGGIDNYDVIMTSNSSTVITGQNVGDYFYGTSTETGAKYKFEIGEIDGVDSVVRILMKY